MRSRRMERLCLDGQTPDACTGKEEYSFHHWGHSSRNASQRLPSTCPSRISLSVGQLHISRDVVTKLTTHIVDLPCPKRTGTAFSASHSLHIRLALAHHCLQLQSWTIEKDTYELRPNNRYNAYSICSRQPGLPDGLELRQPNWQPGR